MAVLVVVREVDTVLGTLLTAGQLLGELLDEGNGAMAGDWNIAEGTVCDETH